MTSSRAAIVLSLSFSIGCSGDVQPGWALQHAVVTVDEEGRLSGFQTWELYAPKWSRKQKERHHLCALVEELSGEQLDAPRCPECADGFLVAAAVADTDCEERWLVDLSAATVSFELLVGAALTADESTAEVSGPRQGWYQRFGPPEDAAQVQGHIWPESGASDALPMLVADERYVLWPTSAWSLQEE